MYLFIYLFIHLFINFIYLFILRTCQLIDITQAAKGVNQSASLKRASFSLKILSQSLADIKRTSNDQITKIEQDRLNALMQIDQIRMKINKRLDEAEQETRAELATRCNSVKQTAIDQLKEIDDIINDVESFLARFDSPEQTGSEKSLFISLKHCKSVQEKATRFVKNKRSNDFDFTINYKPDDGIEHLMTEIQSFGSFTENGGSVDSAISGSPIDANLHGLYSLKDKQDGKQYQSFASTFLDDGTMIIADELNNALKRFNISFKLIQTLKIPDPPSCLCKVSTDEIVLGTERDVFRVHVGANLSLDRKLKTLDTKCRAVAFNEGLHYVAHGGGDFQGPAHIGVYDLHWNFLRKMGRDWLEFPVFLIVSKSGDKLYVSDLYNGVVSFNKNGQCLAIYNERYITYANGICEIARDVLLVSGEGSHNVLQIKDGRIKVREVLSEEDGIRKPQSLCYDEKKSRLVVLLARADHFRVYDLKQK